MSDATERAERLAGMLILAAWNADDRELAREAAHLLREVARELATLRADFARVTEEASEHRSIVASLWDYLRSRDAVPPREGSDHDRIMVGLGTLELRATAALAAERERVAKAVWDEVGPLLESEGCDCGAVAPMPHDCFPGMMEAALRRALMPTPTTEARDGQ